jgi:hypothetical protein
VELEAEELPVEEPVEELELEPVLEVELEAEELPVEEPVEELELEPVLEVELEAEELPVEEPVEELELEPVLEVELEPEELELSELITIKVRRVLASNSTIERAVEEEELEELELEEAELELTEKRMPASVTLMKEPAAQTWERTHWLTEVAPVTSRVVKPEGQATQELWLVEDE